MCGKMGNAQKCARCIPQLCIPPKIACLDFEADGKLYLHFITLSNVNKNHTTTASFMLLYNGITNNSGDLSNDG